MISLPRASEAKRNSVAAVDAARRETPNFPGMVDFEQSLFGVAVGDLVLYILVYGAELLS